LQNARQGFALALAAVVGEIYAIKLDSLMKLIIEELEVSSGMKGQVLTTWICTKF
jgi:DNA polymerase phi